jgi:hypothetical protein
MLDRIIYTGAVRAESCARWIVDNPMGALALLVAALFAMIYWALRVSLREKNITRREW